MIQLKKQNIAIYFRVTLFSGGIYMDKPRSLCDAFILRKHSHVINLIHDVTINMAAVREIAFNGSVPHFAFDSPTNSLEHDESGSALDEVFIKHLLAFYKSCMDQILNVIIMV